MRPIKRLKKSRGYTVLANGFTMLADERYAGKSVMPLQDNYFTMQEKMHLKD